MAKKSKVKNKSPGIPSQCEKTVLNQSVISILAKVGIKGSEELINELPEEKRIELTEMTLQLETLIEDYESKSADIKQKEMELAKGFNEIKSKKESLDQEVKQYKKEHALFLQDKSKFNDDQKELAILKLNAEAGFLSERDAIFRDLQEQFDELKLGIDKFQASRTENFVSKIKMEQELLDAAKFKADKYLLSKTQELSDRESKIIDKEELLNEEKANFEQAKIEHNSNMSRLAKNASLKFERESTLLNQKIEDLGQAREKDLNLIKELSSKLSSYKELERQSEISQLGGPKEFLEYIEKLKSEVKELRSQLLGRTEEDLSVELEQYKALYEEYLDKFNEASQLNIELKQKNAGHNISVVEKLELQRQLEVLQLHNGTLKSHIENLKSDLDELLDKQTNKEAFPQLLKMDREYISPITTETVSDLKSFVKDLQHKMAIVEDTVLYYDLDVIRKLVAGLAMSHLHIFQGISGTGKTSIVKAFAKAMGGHVTTVPVQAGWRDRDDLLGHYNAFEKRYYEKECLQGLYRAKTESYKNRINIVLLDEMNLSRPEQYFAEFLSALEMREGEQEIVLMDSTVANSPKEFKEQRKISLDNNIWFMGTANHDETTFEFADKTHDRAFLMDLERQDMTKDWRPEPVEIKPVDLGSLQKLFEKIIKSDSKKIAEYIQSIKSSPFVQTLESKFGIGWGNRFEKQAIRFMCVFTACSDDRKKGLTCSLEHLLMSRIIRKGKVLSRFDIRQDDITELSESIIELFKDLNFDEPDRLISLLNNEKMRKSEGGY